MEIYDLTAVKGKEWRVKGLILLFTLYASPFTLHAAIPDGYIVRVDSATAYLDWGKTSGVQTGDTFDVYRAGAVLKHPVTGEVLGQTEDAVGQGVVETVSDKYSVGHIVERAEDWKSGDRTRLKVATPALAPVPSVAAPAMSSVPQLIWQSSPIAGTPRSIAIGDVEGSGTSDVVVAFQDRIELYNWQKDHLEKIATYADRHAGNWMTVDVADPGQTGHAEIFATWYLEGTDRARVAAIEWSSGTLKESSHFDGFARAFPRPDGTRPLLVQDLSLAHELRISEPKSVIVSNGKFKTGPIIALPHPLPDSQLFGYAWGDWDNDKIEDFSVLFNGEQLRIFFKDKKWSADSLYGGTKLSFSYSHSFDAVATLYPRLTPLKTTDKTLLLVPYNESATGLHFTRIKAFRSGELLALGWNGLEMAPVWRIPVSSYIADYATGSIAAASQSEVWLLTEGSSDQSILIGYKLP